MKFLRRPRLLSAILMALISTAAYPQQTGIAGRVTDLSGAVLPGVDVKVNALSGASFSTKTNSAGAYEFPALSAGDYVVTVTQPGFTTVKRSGARQPQRIFFSQEAFELPHIGFHSVWANADGVAIRLDHVAALRQNAAQCWRN